MRGGAPRRCAVRCPLWRLTLVLHCATLRAPTARRSEAAASTGYSPILSFNVPDLDTRVTALLSHGAVLDGPIKYPPHGKVAALRTPDGHMISLYEPADGSV